MPDTPASTATANARPSSKALAGSTMRERVHLNGLDGEIDNGGFVRAADQTDRNSGTTSCCNAGSDEGDVPTSDAGVIGTDMEMMCCRHVPDCEDRR